MCSSTMNTCLWNTGQNRLRTDVALFILALLLYHIGWSAQSDFLDTMTKQFFGFLSDDNKSGHESNQHDSQNSFVHMFGLNGQQTQHQPQRHPPPNRYTPASNHKPPPPHVYRQGYYPPPPAGHHYPPAPVHVAPAGQAHYAYGQQQGFGQTRPATNDTSTPQPRSREHYNVPQSHYAPHPDQQIHYAAAPHVVAEYHPHPPPEAEYYPPVSEYHEPVVQIQHAPPPAEYHSYPEEHHYHPTHTPKRFQVSYNEPSPDLTIIDKNIRLPPVKFRFHINPKITITTNTKDPLEKKEKENDHHDIEPYPPPDVYSDAEAPPSYNSRKTEHYPVEHAYPVAHYPVEHYPVAHQYGEPVYDLTHLNPHRSSGHYEPILKIKTRPIVFTDPPPTRGTTTTTTARPTTSTTTTTTTRRPSSRTRSRVQARNPGFSVSFTQRDSTSTATSIQRSVTVSPSTSSTTSETSIFGSSGRERESDSTSVIKRKDSDVPVVSSEAGSTSTTTRSTTTAGTTRSTTTTTTTTTPASTSSTTTSPATTSSTTTTPSTTTTTAAPTTTSTTTTTTATPATTKTPTTLASTTSISTGVPTTAATTASSTSFVTLTSVVTRTSSTPAEITTARSRTLNSNANEIDMDKKPTNNRRRLEPLTAEEAALESSESVKVIETTMLIDGKNQTVRFYYITQPVKLPLDIFNQMTGQKAGSSGLNMVKLRDKRFTENEDSGATGLFSPP